MTSKNFVNRLIRSGGQSGLRGSVDYRACYSLYLLLNDLLLLVFGGSITTQERNISISTEKHVCPKSREADVSKIEM